jgi:cupin fold WbuC family metalloprotein
MSTDAAASGRCTLIDEALLDQTSRAARQSTRLRRNHNFHTADDDASHRLINAMEPGSYVMPHRHLHPDKDETFVVLRGTFGLLLFDDTGAITETRLLWAGGETLGANVPHGTWHSLVSFEPGSVFLEAKGGPYVPLTAEELAPWAPPEGDPGVAAYLASMESRFEG